MLYDKKSEAEFWPWPRQWKENENIRVQCTVWIYVSDFTWRQARVQAGSRWWQAKLRVGGLCWQGTWWGRRRSSTSRSSWSPASEFCQLSLVFVVVCVWIDSRSTTDQHWIHAIATSWSNRHLSRCCSRIIVTIKNTPNTTDKVRQSKTYGITKIRHYQ